MPKVKIGEKVVAGEIKLHEKKKISEGHKSFTSLEARILAEQLAREQKTLHDFESHKETFLKPRNPITGDITPRIVLDNSGDVKYHTGEFLFPKRLPDKAPESEEKANEYYGLPSYRAVSTPTSQVNKVLPPMDSTRQKTGSPSPYKKSNKTDECISALQNRQDHISGEIEYLKVKLREKQQAIADFESHRS